MIKYHPNDEILAQFVSGKLPAAINVAISIHIEMCECCQEKVSHLTKLAAEENLVEASVDDPLSDFELNDLFEQIVQDERLDVISAQAPKRLSIADKQIELPSALNQLELSEWSGFGKVNRCRVKLDNENIRSSLLHIGAGGEIPAHTHKGQELTVLLDGSFKDELGEYQRGDFIWLSGEHEHQPVSEKGCLCFAVVTDPLHFTEGFSRLLNPIGKLIY